MANRDIERGIDAVEGTISQEDVHTPEYTRVYQVYPNSKIPVSKRLGSFWQRRCEEGVSYLTNRNVKTRWDEAIRYYQNDQGGNRHRRTNLSEVSTGRIEEQMYGTENIVFANTSALVPVVYAKNPEVEITTEISAQEKKALMHEKLVDTLFSRRVAPGLNLKPKMRRAVIMTMLTNLCYLELSYVKKEQSSEAVVQEIEALSEQLANAKDIKEIAEIEGKLQALDQKVNLLSESGPQLRTVEPHHVIVDPASNEPDLSDAKYVIVADFIRTEMLRAIYGNKDENGEWKSIYDPTHVAAAATEKTNISGHDEEIQNFALLDKEADYQKYGYKNEEDYRDACRTKVWMVWDKTTRRVLMFNDKDWSMPIWVWDDPYNLTRFFPIFALTFYTDPVDRYARSEVMYYLDQQDEINRINNERARMRHWASTKVFAHTAFLKDIDKLGKFLSGQIDDKVYGIDIPENVKITDVLGTMPLPSMQFEQLFDTAPLLQSIDRMSSVTPILQNVQFKTNTTNKAIETYESSTQMRLDEKIDAIEDVLGEIGVALIEMCIQFMSEEQVIALIGKSAVDEAGGWDNDMSPAQFHEAYSFRVVGGSTLKPTSKVKKEQATNLGQVLGQFASGIPAASLVALKAIERAYSEDVVITEEEWSLLTQQVEAATQQMLAPKGSMNGGGRPVEGSAAPVGAPAQGGAPSADQAMSVIEQLISRLPPDGKAAVGEAIAQGVPLKQIVAQLVQAPQGTQ